MLKDAVAAATTDMHRLRWAATAVSVVEAITADVILAKAMRRLCGQTIAPKVALTIVAADSSAV
jgi:hypothetical protein